MPNWCSNKLAVEGPPDAVDAWSNDVSGVDGSGQPVPLDFERVLPTPPEFSAGKFRSAQAEELLSQYLAADLEERRRLARAQPLLATMTSNIAFGRTLEDVTLWDAADWRTHNWGTKWSPVADGFRVERLSAPGRPVIRFSTAWAPPRALIYEMARRYGELSFDLAYSEPDGGFAGRLVVERGEILVDEETQDPPRAIALLAEAGWADAGDDWREPDDDEG
jgi:hypothetical protein